MKKLLILFFAFVFFAANGFAQHKEATSIFTKNKTTGTYYYEAVKKAPHIAKPELFTRARRWLKAHGQTMDNSSVYDDKKYHISIFADQRLDTIKELTCTQTDGAVNFKINLSFKNGKYTIRVDDIILSTVTSAVNGQNVGRQTMPYRDIDFKRIGGCETYLKERINRVLAIFIANLNNAIKDDFDDIHPG